MDLGSRLRSRVESLVTVVEEYEESANFEDIESQILSFMFSMWSSRHFGVWKPGVLQPYGDR